MDAQRSGSLTVQNPIYFTSNGSSWCLLSIALLTFWETRALDGPGKFYFWVGLSGWLDQCLTRINLKGNSFLCRRCWQTGVQPPLTDKIRHFHVYYIFHKHFALSAGYKHSWVCWSAMERHGLKHNMFTKSAHENAHGTPPQPLQSQNIAHMITYFNR